MAKQFGIPFYYKNKLDMIKMILEVHLMLNPSKENMVERAKEALAYYILYGFNKETVKDIETSLSEKVKKGYVRSINTHLRNNGYLVRDKNNKQKSYLSPEMEEYRKQFVLNEGKTFTIGFLQQNER